MYNLCMHCIKNERCDRDPYTYAHGKENCSSFQKKVSKEEDILPRAERISGWGSGIEILYHCGICDNSLPLGSLEVYCHTCGQKVNWSVQQFLTEKEATYFAKIRGQCDDEAEKVFIDAVNKKNKGGN